VGGKEDVTLLPASRGRGKASASRCVEKKKGGRGSLGGKKVTRSRRRERCLSYLNKGGGKGRRLDPLYRRGKITFLLEEE